MSGLKPDYAWERWRDYGRQKTERWGVGSWTSAILLYQLECRGESLTNFVVGEKATKA